MSLGFARAGDIFLSLLGKKLHINIDYKNHSGFLSCLVLRFIELDEPFFALEDFDLTLGCKKAYVEPCFDKLLTEKAIILKCALKDASFLNIEGQGELSVLLDKIGSIVYDAVYMELAIYNDSVRFPFYQAYAKEAKLYASGSVTESGDLNLNLEVFFSPEIAAQFPEELIEILRQESKGWLSYRMHIESSEDTPFLKLETDRFRLDFKEIGMR